MLHNRPLDPAILLAESVDRPLAFSLRQDHRPAARWFRYAPYVGRVLYCCNPFWKIFHGSDPLTAAYYFFAIERRAVDQ